HALIVGGAGLAVLLVGHAGLAGVAIGVGIAVRRRGAARRAHRRRLARLPVAIDREVKAAIVGQRRRAARRVVVDVGLRGANEAVAARQVLHPLARRRDRAHRRGRVAGRAVQFARAAIARGAAEAVLAMARFATRRIVVALLPVVEIA